MDNQSPVFAPLGRLYDPLLQLAKRVHTALLIREKTVWVDHNGYVFATSADLLGAISPHATIGLYAKWTPLPMIELGLRRALRERASAWIVDWTATYPLAARAADQHILRFTALRKRKRKRKSTATQTRATKTQPRPPDAGQPDRAQPQY
ncbi:MAG TPA: hypothetical protein VGT79_05885 [Xanthomonadaceae bacterium]|nr:hypothetical protein [Xanthomonadaceae bacterium]